MKKVLAVVLAVVMLSGVVMAQDAANVQKEGAKSLNFTFGGLGTFAITGTGPAGGLGLSYFLSSDAAVRLGLQVGIAGTTTPWNDNSGNGTNPGSDGSTSNFTLGVGGDYLMYMGGASSRIRPYVGAGVGITITSNSTKNAVPTNAPNGTTLETSGGSFGLGLSGILGAEFFLFPELGLSAEYTLGLFNMTSNSDSKTTRKGMSDVTSKNGGSSNILGFSGGGATLQFYF